MNFEGVPGENFGKKISYPPASFSIRNLYPIKSDSFQANPWKKNKFNPNESEPILNQPKNFDPNEFQLIRIR